MTTSNVYPFPVIKPGFKLVPARTGRGDRKQICYIECPLWCTDDHVANWQYDLEDVSHYGDIDSMQVPTMTDPDTALYEWHTRMASDPTASEPSLRAAHVLISDSGAVDARLTPDAADEVADELIGFASAIRHAARSARLANQTSADSDPDMDEALRRVRGEAV